MRYIILFHEITKENQKLVGGKNASLGHMIRDLKDKVSIPDGFAITTEAYRYFLQSAGLSDPIEKMMHELNAGDETSFLKGAQKIRDLIIQADFPKDLEEELLAAYQALSATYHEKDCTVAVRSSATVEDSTEASFAGQQESYVYISGAEALLLAIKKCMASLFNDRAIVYRIERGFLKKDMALSVGVQKMVHADTGVAGVAFTLDTETGFKDVVLINASWGLGETIVKGEVTPDEYVVFKPLLQTYMPIIKKKLGDKKIKMIYDPAGKCTKAIPTSSLEQQHFCLSDEEIMQLTRYAVIIEEYYTQRNGYWSPQDIEWAKDGRDGKIYIVQARPETVHARDKEAQLQTYCIAKSPEAHRAPLITGMSVGQKIISGKAHVITSVAEISRVQKGDIIVTEMTDPDWGPAMQKAAGIVTDRGGRTCHAAIVSRELGIPAIVGTQNGTEMIKDGQEITLDCSRGAVGYIYAGKIPFETTSLKLTEIPKLKSRLFVNIAEPDRAFTVARLPVDGVGLARLEFILSTNIGIHPMALCDPKKISRKDYKLIKEKTVPYTTPQEFYISTLSQYIGMIAAAFYPKEVIVRLSDFKTNEYRALIGGAAFEPVEDNPMLGWRGASRYYNPAFAPAFALECAAFKRAREELGFKNIHILVPFVRTVNEAQAVIKTLAQNGLDRSNDNLQILMMCEIPSNVLLITEFAKLFDGFSIGSNDLTQLILGVDRDSEILANLFCERDPAVRLMCQKAVEGAHKARLPIGICGQGPSDYPDWAEELIDMGIDYISLNADAVASFLLHITKNKDYTDS